MTELEITLLVDRRFSITTYGNGVTAGGSAPGLGEHSLIGHGLRILTRIFPKFEEKR